MLNIFCEINNENDYDTKFKQDDVRIMENKKPSDKRKFING